jgi:hypothetical protein
MNLATFRVQYPEFKSALDPFVQAFLDAAAREINPTELGEAYDNAHGLLTAHKLAISPFGKQARMVNEDGRTTYENEYDAVLRRSVLALAVS